MAIRLSVPDAYRTANRITPIPAASRPTFLSLDQVYGAGKPAAAAPTFLSLDQVYGVRPTGQDTPMQAVGQNVLEAFKAVPGGAVSMGGVAMSGAGALLQGTVRRQLEVMDRIDRGEPVPEMEDAAGYQHMNPEQRAQVRQEVVAAATRPLSEQPLVKSGQAVTEYGQTMLPEILGAKPGYEESPGRRIGSGLGGLVAGAGVSMLTGPVGAGALFALAGSGEAAERAMKAGVSEDDVIAAAQAGVIPGLTDSLPVETLLGRVPIPGAGLIKVPAGMLGRALKGIGRIGWQAFVEGAQEGGQQFLQNLIAQEVYEPEQELGEGVVPSAGVGGGVGAIAEMGRQAIMNFAGRRAARAPAPAPEQPSAEAAPAPEQPGTPGDIVSEFEQSLAGRAPPEPTGPMTMPLPPEPTATAPTVAPEIIPPGRPPVVQPSPPRPAPGTVQRMSVEEVYGLPAPARADLPEIAPPAEPRPERRPPVETPPVIAMPGEVAPAAPPAPVERVEPPEAPTPVPEATPAPGEAVAGGKRPSRARAPLPAERRAAKGRAAAQENLANPDLQETKPASKFGMAWLDGLDTETKERAFVAMRSARARSDAHMKKAADLTPRGAGVVSVGAANFDESLRGDAISRVLYLIGNRNMTPQEAGEEAKQDARRAIESHNSKRPNDVNWPRWEGAADSAIDRAVQEIEIAVKPPPSPVEQRPAPTPPAASAPEATPAPGEAGAGEREASKALAPVAFKPTRESQSTTGKMRNVRFNVSTPDGGSIFTVVSFPKDEQLGAGEIKRRAIANAREIWEGRQPLAPARQEKRAPLPAERRAAKAAAAPPKSLFQFIRSRGGMKDTGGELRAMDLHKRGRGLIKPKGLGQDYMLTAAIEAGYFPEDATLNDLFEAMRQEESGAKVYTDADRDRVQAAEQELAAAEALDQIRLDVKAYAREIGETFSDSEIAEIVREMDRDGLDAETAVSNFAERKAVQAIDQFAEDSGDQAYEDIPFDAPAEPAESARIAGTGDQRPARQAADQGASTAGQAAAGEDGAEVAAKASARDAEYVASALAAKSPGTVLLASENVYYSPLRPLTLVKGGPFRPDLEHHPVDPKLLTKGLDPSRVLVSEDLIPISQLNQHSLIPMTPLTKIAAIKEAYEATPGTEPNIWVFKSPRPGDQDSGRGLVITRSTSEEGKFQATWFDVHGFGGHTVHNTFDDALREHVIYHYTEPAPDFLETVSELDTFEAQPKPEITTETIPEGEQPFDLPDLPPDPVDMEARAERAAKLEQKVAQIQDALRRGRRLRHTTYQTTTVLDSPDQIRFRKRSDGVGTVQIMQRGKWVGIFDVEQLLGQIPSQPTTEQTPEGLQTVLPGAEQISQAAAGEDRPQRYEVGKSLTKDERKRTLDSLADVYKLNRLEKEETGLDRRGEMKLRYPHRPDLFVKSDITGAMLRYYVTLPDGRIAHPTELFPDYTQNDVEKEMARRESQARETRLWVKDRTKPEHQFDTLEAARRYWQEKSDASRAQSAGGWPTFLPPDKREAFTNGAQIILLPSGGDWLTGERLEALAEMGWRRADKPITTEAAPEGEQTVPHSVRKNVQHAVTYLREIEQRVDEAAGLEQRVGGRGRYQADVFRNRANDIERGRAKLAEFRRLAREKGIDPEPIIAEAGGEPALRPSPEAQAWLEEPDKGPPERSDVTTEQTEAGEQTVLPGAEQISQREMLERRMAGRDVRRGQKGLEGAPLFDEGARAEQADLLSAAVPPPRARPSAYRATPSVESGGNFPIAAVKMQLGDKARTIYEQTPNNIYDMYRDEFARRWDEARPDASGYVSANRTDQIYAGRTKPFTKTTTPRTKIRVRGEDMAFTAPEVTKRAAEVDMPPWREFKAAFDEAMQQAKRQAVPSPEAGAGGPPSGTIEFHAGLPFGKLWDWFLGPWFAKHYDTFGTLPGGKRRYMQPRRVTQGRVDEMDRIAGDLHRRLNGYDAATKDQIYDFLTTAGAAPSMINDPLARRDAVAAKRLIDIAGRELVHRGALKQEQYDKYRDAYLPRIYLKFLFESEGVSLGAGSRPIVSKSMMDRLKKRKDLPQWEREILLGQIKDPAYLVARAFGEAARSIAIWDFLETVASHPEWIYPQSVVQWRGRSVTARWLESEAQRLRGMRDKYPPEMQGAVRDMADEMEAAAREALADPPDSKLYKQVPDSKRYGYMRGLWVRKEIYDDIVNSTVPTYSDENFQHIAQKARNANSVWKGFKTAWSLPAQVRNLMSGYFASHVFGEVPFHRMPDRLIATIRDIHSNGPYWQAAKRHGVKSTSFAQSELLQIHNEFKLKASLAHYKKNPYRFVRELLSRLNDKIGNVYSLNEQLWKTLVMMHHMKNGMSEADAADKAHDAIFDYSDVPNVVRHLRNTPLPYGIPFLTFSYKALPKTIEAALKRPWAYMPYVAMVYGSWGLLKGLNDLDDEEAEKLWKVTQDWLQHGLVAFLPGKDQHGRWQPIDLSYILPFGSWWNIAQKARKGDVIGAGSDLGIGSHPWFDVPARVLIANKDGLGRPIYTEGAPRQQQLQEVFAYLLDRLAPSATFNVGKEIVQAAAGKVNKRGEPIRTPTQAATRMFGVNVYPLDTQSERGKRLYFLERDVQDAQQELSRIGRDRSLSREERRRQIERQRARVTTLNQRVRDYGRETAGVPR